MRQSKKDFKNKIQTQTAENDLAEEPLSFHNETSKECVPKIPVY